MKTKIILTLILFIGLLIETVLIAALLVVVFANDVTKGNTGIISILAFILAAVIIGWSINRVVDRIKILWL